MFDEPLKVQRLMQNFNADWFVAGGWAIDLFVGKETRNHDDIEIAIFRKDQIALQNYFADWQMCKAQSGELSVWKKGEFLELPLHEIHCFKKNAAPPTLEVLLNETDGTNWIYRRNAKITKPLSEIYFTTNSGIKFLRPEIVLLYKSKNPHLKDEQDFEVVAKSLNEQSKKWLKNALTICYNEHPWLQNI